MARPSAQPELWLAYLRGAQLSYRQYGVESVLEFDKVCDGKSTAIFFTALDEHGRVSGGMRVQGPYLRANQAHAMQEWAGRQGSEQVHAEVAERIPAGVIEMKTGWAADDTQHRAELTAALARVFVHSMTVMGVRYALGTVAAHAVKRWQTTGGVVSPKVTPVAYPDDRYLTKLLWWDRHTYADLTVSDQLPHIMSESTQLSAHIHAGASEPSRRAA